MSGCQLLEVSVSLQDGNDYLVNLVNSLVQASLIRQKKKTEPLLPRRRRARRYSTLSDKWMETMSRLVYYFAEELGGLLQQPHEAALGEVAARAHAVLIGGQDVIRHGRLLQHIGGDALRRENPWVQSIT